MKDFSFNLIDKMSTEEQVKFLYELDMTIHRLRQELRNCRGELCLRCGNYKTAHLGSCDDCRYRHGGEWEEDLHDE